MIDTNSMTPDDLAASAAARYQRQQAEQQAHDSLTEFERTALSYLRMTAAAYLARKEKSATDGD